MSEFKNKVHDAVNSVLAAVVDNSAVTVSVLCASTAYYVIAGQNVTLGLVLIALYMFFLGLNNTVNKTMTVFIDSIYSEKYNVSMEAIDTIEASVNRRKWHFKMMHMIVVSTAVFVLGVVSYSGVTVTTVFLLLLMFGCLISESQTTAHAKSMLKAFKHNLIYLIKE